MGFFNPHTIVVYLIYPMLALASYFLIICSICIFLAFGEESDQIRAQSADGSQPNC
jgi:hypothetical protein